MDNDTAPQFRKETDASGAFVRQPSAFRRWVSADGSSGLPAMPGRYHLYVSYACPWAHRAIIVRMLKGLDDAISMSAVDPIRDELGWRFTTGPAAPGCEYGADPVNGFAYLSEAYHATDRSFAGRVTVPTLWDRETLTVVSNESSDIIRMLTSEFDAHARNPGLDLYPDRLRTEIDHVNGVIYPGLNNGVYRAGFATTQAAYGAAVDDVFATLDWLEDRLRASRYLVGEAITEADWRTFTTLIRFDAVYVGHFKCNLRRIADYPNISGYLRELYQMPGITATVDFDQIKRHYYQTHDRINPTRIVPKGPMLDLDAPHGREGAARA